MDPRVTVCIRCLNEQAWIGQCLQQVMTQQYSARVDVLVIDSGSTDRTIEIARRFPVRIHRIPPREFHYAETLNLAVGLSSSDFFVPLSAHAIPADDQWLEPLIDELLAEPLVAAAYSRQMPHDDADPYERLLSEKLFPGHTVPDVTADDLKHGHSFRAVFSNVSSCIRTNLLLETPFRKIPRCEDRLWAAEVARRGHRIRYVPRSVVFHSHNNLPMDYYHMGQMDGAAREIVDGPVWGVLPELFGPLCPPTAVIVDALLRISRKTRCKAAYDGSFARIACSLALHMGQVYGARETRKRRTLI